MMKQPFTKFGVTTLFSLLCSAFLHAQVVTDERMFSFEEPQIPDCITATHSRLSVSDLHYKDGKHSLEWTFEPGGILELKKDLKFEKKDPTGKDLYLSAFIVWVYNEVPQDATIEFQFLKDGKRCTSFPFGINFSGWRAAWVCYERDMQGTPEEGMNELRIIAPNSKGSLFIDHLITATKVDARQQTADLQVPFVNAGTTNHWLVVYQHSLLKPDIELTPVDDKQRAEMQLLEKRFRDMIYTKGKTTDKEVETIRKKYDFYQITYKNGQVSGVPIYMVRASEAYERIIPNWDKDMLTKMGVEMRAYFDLMKRIAVAYNNAANPVIREEMKKKFLAMYDHITDQGVAYGSCWGNIHHYGYSVRGLYLAYFLMKDVLRETGKLQEAERTLRWYAITNEVYPKPEVNGIDMDSFNTQTTGASNDFEQATQMARAMVAEYGMSEKMGPMQYEGNHAMFGGQTTQKYISERTAYEIDNEVRDLLNEARNKAADIIQSNREKHKLIAEALLKYETLDSVQIKSLYETGKMPEHTEHGEDDVHPLSYDEIKNKMNDQ